MKPSVNQIFFQVESGEDPFSLRPKARQFLDWLRVSNYRPSSVYHRGQQLRLFILWCEDRDLHYPQDITTPILERYQKHLYHHQKADGGRLSVSSQEGRLAALRLFFQWLVKQGILLYNPAANLESPKRSQRLPRQVLSLAQVNQILNLPDVSNPLELRDKAILETFYSTGLRLRELNFLKLEDLAMSQGTLRVRQGKGDKERVIPIGKRALGWIERYLDQARPLFVREPDLGYVFLTHRGKHFNPAALSFRIRRYVREIGINEGSCHLFRHTMATLMLESGADIRYVQQMLGHVKLETTQVYTHLSIGKLKEVHSKTHPGA